MIRLAVIGLGAATRNLHLPAWRRLRNRLTVVGGADPDPAARQWATEAGITPVFADPAALLAATRPDLVTICTPPDLHRAHTEMSLDAGCHVFLEKPAALTLEEMDQIIAASARSGRHVVVNNQFPWMRIHAAARAQLGTPDFGRLLHLHAAHTMQPTPATEAGWRGTMSRRIGIEFGIHVFDLVRFFFGATPARIIAHRPHPLGGDASEVVLVSALEFPDGRSASVMLNRLSHGPAHYLDLTLDGEHASIHTSLGGALHVTLGIHPRRRRPFADLQVAGGGRAVLWRGTRPRLLATDPVNPFARATSEHLGGGSHRSGTAGGSRHDGGGQPGQPGDGHGDVRVVLHRAAGSGSACWPGLTTRNPLSPRWHGDCDPPIKTPPAEPDRLRPHSPRASGSVARNRTRGFGGGKGGGHRGLRRPLSGQETDPNFRPGEA